MTEYFEIFLPGEKPNVDNILKRMGEYDSCILTGDTEDLGSVPVDFNPANILPSNMARISKKFLDKAPLVVDYEIREVLPADLVLTTHFRSFYHFYKYNKQVFNEKINPEHILSRKQIDFLSSDNADERFNGSALTEIFWNLTTSHIKGIDKVTLHGFDGLCFTMDYSAFQAFIMGDVERRRPKSNIITPSFGGGY